MSKAPTWRSGNRLLDRLPADARERLRPHLQAVELPIGKVLYESDKTKRAMYFPRSGVVSLLYVTEGGDTGEVAMVGNEGVVGVPVLVDCNATPTRAEVQVAGEATMLASKVVEREFQRGGAFQDTIVRYTQLMLGQLTQALVCNRHHAMERQLCRWLLSAFDRVDGGELPLTQEALAQLLGVRREGVSEAAGRLRDAGMVSYSRGRIRLLDRCGLEQRSCGCYQAMQREYDRLLGEKAAA